MRTRVSISFVELIGSCEFFWQLKSWVRKQSSFHFYSKIWHRLDWQLWTRYSLSLGFGFPINLIRITCAIFFIVYFYLFILFASLMSSAEDISQSHGLDWCRNNNTSMGRTKPQPSFKWRYMSPFGKISYNFSPVLFL